MILQEPPQLTAEEYRTLQLNRSLALKDHDPGDRAVYLISRLAQFAPTQPPPRVLCVGCRNGRELDYLARAGFTDTIGIDLHAADPRVRVMDMHRLDFAPRAFDIVYASHCLEHALDPHAAAREMLRVLKPGGRIAIEVPVEYGRRGADLWDFKSPAGVAALFPGTIVQWSETGPQIGAGKQLAARVILQLTREPIQPERLDESIAPSHSHDLHYSIRRYFVDEFFERSAATLPPGARVIDVGGKNGRKRGRFELSRFDVCTTCVNSSPAARPDILADASNIPLESFSADVVILSEVIEHLADPLAALREASRLLRQGGSLLATAPFLFRVHPDPIDVGRYTPHWWNSSLNATGFTDVTIEAQGSLPSVAAELFRGWAKHMSDTAGLPEKTLGMLLPFVQTAREQALAWERANRDRMHEYITSFTTGYGVRATKA